MSIFRKVNILYIKEYQIMKKYAGEKMKAACADKLDDVEMTTDEIRDFKRQLFAGEVKFKFKKKDGTMREARGTTCPDLLPPPPPQQEYNDNALRQARPQRVKPANIICFYDLDAQGWRSFDSNRFEGIID